MTAASPAPLPRRRNRNVALGVAGVAALMVGASFAAVPLYELFCAVTGFGGTTQRAEAAPAVAAAADIQVRFDANVIGLPWTFRPVEISQTARIGVLNTAFYDVTNTSDRTTAGFATFNVTPQAAGAYFVKTACFCFEVQPLAPGETQRVAVAYFVDPKILDDRDTNRISGITLSYTFHASGTPVTAAEAAPGPV